MSSTEKIQFVDLVAQYRSLQAPLDAAVAKIMGRGDFILGEDVATFEKEFAAFCHSEHCVGVADGGISLTLALRALGVGPGDEVIVPTHTFIASVTGIWAAGATPVFVDVDPRYYTIDPHAVAKAITPKTKCIMPVHLYGQPADMDPLLELAKKHRLFVVEDTAQAHGAEYKGRRCGSIGDVGSYSFYPGKNLGCYGDGGAITTNRKDLADKIRAYRSYGQTQKNIHFYKGMNSRLDTIQAAVLRVKLPHLQSWNEARLKAATRYQKLLSGTHLGLPETAPYTTRHVWHLYVVQTTNRTGLQTALDAGNISHGVHYPIPCHLQEAFKDLGYGVGSFPVTEALASRIVSLPIFPELSDHQAQRVATACAGF